MEIVKHLAATFGPIILPLIFGAGFLGFLLKRLDRRDAVSDRGFLNDQELAERVRFWQAVALLADGHGRHITQLVGPMISAHCDGKYEAVEAFMLILKDAIGTETEGKWKLNPHPDFVEEVRKDWDKVDGERNGPKKEN